MIERHLELDGQGDTRFVVGTGALSDVWFAADHRGRVTHVHLTTDQVRQVRDKLNDILGDGNTFIEVERLQARNDALSVARFKTNTERAKAEQALHQARLTIQSQERKIEELQDKLDDTKKRLYAEREFGTQQAKAASFRPLTGQDVLNALARRAVDGDNTAAKALLNYRELTGRWTA